MDRKISRRNLLKQAGLCYGAAKYIGSPKCDAATDMATLRPNIADLDPKGSVIRVFKAGVSAMKLRSKINATDPTGWLAQAQIHYDHCPHGNWFLLPWHRAYLHFFERICREASRDNDFVLPYWDWTTQPKLPEVFWGDDTNPLFDGKREITPNDPIPAEFVNAGLIQSILENPDFISAIGSDPTPAPRPSSLGQSVLEGTPHNNVHGTILGDMGGYMSPLDPIFWLHHANIDRIWTLWDGMHPGAFPGTEAYLNYEMKDFFDVSGRPASLTVAQTKNTFDLGYRYPDQKPGRPLFSMAPVPNPPAILRTSATPDAAAAVNSPLQVALSPPDQLRDFLGNLGRHQRTGVFAAAAAPPSGTVRLKISGIEKSLPPGAFVRVFLNCDYLNQNTSIADRHYVGSFSFFGHAAAGQPNAADHPVSSGGNTFYLNATKTIQDLNGIEQFDPNRLRVGLVVRTRQGVSLTNELLQVKPTQIGLEVTGLG